MHEFGIAASIYDAIVTEAARLDNGMRVVKAVVSVGDLSGVDVEALRFSFEAIVADSQLAPMELQINRLTHRRRCDECTNEFEVQTNDFDVTCPACQTLLTSCVAGTELDIEYLEVEDQ